MTADAPSAKPEVVEAPAPEAKPEDAQAQAQKAEALAAEAEKKPEPAPREAVMDAAPETKPDDAASEASAVAAEAETDMEREADPVVTQPAVEAPTPKPDDAAAKAAAVAGEAETEMEREADPAVAEPADTKPAEKPAAKPAANAEPKAEAAPAETSVGDNPDALKDALAAEAKAAQGQTATPEAEAETETETEEARAKAEAEAANIANLVENLAPPEAAAEETAAAVEAAEAKAPAANDALKALADGATAAAAGGQVSEMTVSADDARRSDEDFTTSVAKSIADAVGAQKTEGEAKAKSDDNKGRDLARLALVGMAGMAVGSMLSNNREVALNTGDRVVVTLPDGSQQLIKNDDTLLFQPGSNVQTEKFSDGSTITTVTRADGSKVMTIRDANMNVLRRTVQSADGTQTDLIDDTAESEPVRVSELPPPARPIVYQSSMSEDALREALMQQSRVDRHFTLDQIRDIAQVRALVPPLDIQSITFETGSAAVQPDQARQLSLLGRAIAQSIRDNPREIFLIEGYTDAVGSDASNLALSDRRAESVALALSEYFAVPPENLVVQGYGERFLRIQTDQAERANRRVAIRRITELIAQN
ncbi:OmpA family protein [Paracoccus cavernae]|uniref:OmpA family protein n=1 Tax=Paracoccus cavernae TaxID=1571207 RepID=UPI003634BFA3